MRRLARLTAICAPIFLAATNAGAATPTAKVAAPDPLASMPGEISAILDVTTAPRILLMQDEHGTPFPRELKVGDVYRDGWRVVSVAGQSVTLKKGDQQRSVSPRAKPAAAPVMVASLPVQAPAAAPLTGAALGQPQNFGGGRGGRGGGGGFGGRGAGGPGGFGGRAGGRGQEGGFSGSNAALGAGGQARTFQGIPAGASAGAGGIADLAAIMNNPAAQAALANPATQAMIQQQLQQLGGQITPEMMQQMMQQFGGGRNVTVGPNGAPAPPQRPQVLQGAPNFLGPPAVR